MKKKFLIMAYPEGATGMRYTGRHSGAFSMQRMTADVNTAVDAMLEQDCEVFVCDPYKVGRDVFENGLTKKAKQVKTEDLGTLLGGGMDGVLLIGARAMIMAEKAFASFTGHPIAWQRYSLNGKECGDIEIAAALCGAYGVPVIGVSGDFAAVEECRLLVGDIPSAIVKKTQLHHFCAEFEKDDKALTLIAEMAKQAVKKCKDFAPYVVKTPFVARVVYNRADYCDDAMYRNGSVDGVERISPLVAQKKKDKIEEFSDLIIL